MDRRYKIVESVGSKVEPVYKYEDLEKHHPSSGREKGRSYQVLNGRLEEVTHKNDGVLVKKDFVLLLEGSNKEVPVPSPLSGYVVTSKNNGQISFYDKPNGQLLGRVLHLKVPFLVSDGGYVEYGQPIGIQAGTGLAGRQTYPIHVHAELEEKDFKKYISDMAGGNVTAEGLKKPERAESAASKGCTDTVFT